MARFPLVVPSRRWFLVAALLAGAAFLPPGSGAGLAWMLALDVAWALAFMLDAFLTSAPRDLLVRREAPPAFSVGRTLPVRYAWRHRGGRAVTLQVRETFPEPLGGSAAPDRSVRIPQNGAAEELLQVTPAHRGKARSSALAVRIRGPLGLAWRQASLDLPWDATVYPRLAEASLRFLPNQLTRRREAGQRSVRRLGEGRMFETLKEWVPGDDTRTIDWKATARRGKVMSRQYEDERRQQVMLVIDAGRLMTAEIDGVPRLESAIEAALHLAYSALEHDDNIGLMVFADEVQTFVAPSRGRRALRAVLEGLASAEGRVVEPNYPGALGYLAARNRKRALTVLFTDIIDRTASDALLSRTGSLRPRHLPLTVTLRDTALDALGSQRPSSPAQAFERAAAEELLIAREEALGEMRRKGVLTLDVPPRRAAEAVVEQYTQLKRRGLL
ncbi:MAG: DUF58 domain-containing protein [Gemmatimonadota bacterium]